MYKKVEFYADNTDITLIKAALNDLLTKVETEGDQYKISSTINDLLTQFQEIKG